MFKNRMIVYFSCVISLLISSYVQASTNYTLDSQHTYVLWSIKHFGFSTQVGKFYSTGTLVLDKDKPENSKVNATIQTADVVTGIAELDKHLRGKLFFDSNQFPTATFVSDKVVMTGKTTASITGKLTLHGITKLIKLNAKLNQAGISPISNKMTVGFEAHTTIKRSDFGMTTLLPGLGDEVKLDIGVEAYSAT